MLKLRKVEKLVLELAKIDGAKTFLQIGSNDGQYADPINLSVHLGYIHGSVVEPQPAFFKAVQETYAGIRGMKFFNCAISDVEGVLPFFMFAPEDLTIPAWAHGSASMSKAQLLRFEGRIPNVADRIVETRVEIITVNTLLDRMGDAPPDILVVDAEGHDARILAQFDFTQGQPKLVIYETESMSEADVSRLSGRLESGHYKIISLGQDSVALHESTALCRKMFPA